MHVTTNKPSLKQLNEGPKHNEIYSMSVMAPTISTHFMLYPLCSQIICWANHFPTESEFWFYCIQNGKKRPYFDSAEHQCATFKVPLHLIHIQLIASGRWGSHNFYTKYIKVVGLSTLCISLLYSQETSLVLTSVRGSVNFRAIMRARRIRSMKIPMTPLGIEPTSFQLIVQWLNSHM
jgi:hypothetical protein